MFVEFAMRAATTGYCQLVCMLFAALRRWHRRRTAIPELRALPDWQLRDIGVSRRDISALVDKSLTSVTKRPAHATAWRPRLVTRQTPKAVANEGRPELEA